MKYLAHKEALTIKKWPDQVIVFNFDTATNIDLDTFRIQYKNEDNTWRESFSTQSDWQDTSSDGINRTIDFAAQHIVFNCANAKTVQTGGGCGMFFVPKKDSTLTIKYESGAGWIVSAGTVTSDNSLLYENGYDEDSCFEWHGLYSEMPDSMTATLMLEKQIDGEDAELSETFQFSIDRYSVGDQGAVDEENYWNHIETINNEGEAIFYSIADPQGNPIVYRVKEAGVDSADGTYSMDSTVYYARIRIKSISGTQAIATVEYYTDFLGAYNGTEEGKLSKTPTFVNKEMPVYGPKITKKLEEAAT
jgi:hypothetical protein